MGTVPETDKSHLEKQFAGDFIRGEISKLQKLLEVECLNNTAISREIAELKNVTLALRREMSSIRRPLVEASERQAMSPSDMTRPYIDYLPGNTALSKPTGAESRLPSLFACTRAQNSGQTVYKNDTSTNAKSFADNPISATMSQHPSGGAHERNSDHPWKGQTIATRKVYSNGVPESFNHYGHYFPAARPSTSHTVFNSSDPKCIPKDQTSYSFRPFMSCRSSVASETASARTEPLWDNSVGWDSTVAENNLRDW